MDEERHDVGPDEKLCDPCRRQDETVGCLVTHGDGESTQNHVCPGGEGKVSLLTRSSGGSKAREMRTIHGEEGARREEQQHVHDNVEPDGSGSIPVDEAHEETEGHGCGRWVSRADSCVGMVPIHSLVIEMVKTSMYRGRPLRHHAVQCIAAEQPYMMSAITAGQISGRYPAMIRSPSACGQRCEG